MARSRASTRPPFAIGDCRSTLPGANQVLAITRRGRETPVVAQVSKTCCAADFRIGVPQAGWETRDTADLEGLRYKNRDAPG